jgi:AraC-like DNA-binding protein
MAVLLDTTLLPEPRRADAMRDALRAHLPTVAVSVAEPARARISHWSLGPGVDLLHCDAGPHRLTGAFRRPRTGAPGPLCLRHCHDALQLADLGSPYDFHVTEPSVVVTLLVDQVRLGLPTPAVRAAAPRLATSPMYDLARRHLTQLPALLDRIGPGPAERLLASSMVELVRALVASVSAPDAPWLRATATGTLFDRVTAFIAQHQRDPDLGAARLAAEHGASVRAVYAAFAERGQQLSAWVTRGRLRGAHQELAERPTATVASIARSWGFADARHFARRFRAEYGLSPAQWQRDHR